MYVCGVRECSKEFFLFFPSFFLVRNPYYKAWRGRSDDGFVEGSVEIRVYLMLKKRKQERKKRKEKKGSPSSAWFNSMVLYFIKKIDMRYMGTPKQAPGCSPLFSFRRFKFSWSLIMIILVLGEEVSHDM